MKPFINNFKNCLQTGTFSNVVPIYKKGDKHLLQNYRPVSLMPICSKIFEKIIFNPILDFLEEKSSLSTPILISIIRLVSKSVTIHCS